MAVSTLLAFTGMTVSAQEEFSNVISSTVTKINNEKLVGDYSFVMHLSNTDYMTAEEWSEENQNYKWVNADEGRNDFSTVDLNENNLSNFPLNKHLDEYNFEQKILIDGVTLAEFKEQNPYILVGNMRERVDTLAISFQTPVLSEVTSVEILEGCQLPTLARACVGSRATSCIEITQGVKFINHNGTWTKYFEGYQEGKEYNGDENAFYLNNYTLYKEHPAVPLYAFTDFFIITPEVAGGLYDGYALASSGNTQKDYVAVLEFVNPIDVSLFNQLNLRMYSNHKRTIYAYNDEGISEGTLGIALESFTLEGGVFSTANLNTSLYADSDGMLRKIVFKFNEDGEPYVDKNGKHQYDANGNLERDQLFFISFNVSNRDTSELVTKDSLIIVENGDSYDLTFRFNRSGADTGVKLDTSKVVINGTSVKKLLAECKTAKAQWSTIGSIFQICVTVPKSYSGVAQIKNADNGYSSNSMGVVKGLVFPDGTVLNKSYTCHIYATEKFVDSEIETDYQKTEVMDVSYDFVKGSDNLHFKIHFDKKITASNYNHACEIERWRENDLASVNPLAYDKGMSNVFVKNGFKSSLLDNIVINGKTIGEWHAYEPTALTNIQTHYGQSGFEYVDVHFESHSQKSYAPLAEMVKNGNGITIEIREGLKFLTNCSVQKTQTFVLKNGVFVEQVASSTIRVFYDGKEVANGDSVTVKTVVCPSSVAVDGIDGYQISHVTDGNVTVFTVTYGEGQEFKFTVNEDSVAGQGQFGTSETDSQSSEEKKGCKSSVELPALGMLLLVAVAVVTLKEKRKYE